MHNHTTIKTRHDWSRDDVAAIYHRPLLELVQDAAAMHRQVFHTGEVQVCTLLSIKTGGCQEDCKYCSQSSHYSTGVENQALLDVDNVLAEARRAREGGSTRFCMGAAWREARDNRHFDRVCEMVSGVREMGLEVCCTLGMLTRDQAFRLKEAGLTAYNHNLDTGESYYGEVITTRTYQDRLETLQHVRDAGITVCCGGIIGMGETDEHRVELLQTLATLTPHPESVPVNALVAIEGTPLEGARQVDTFEMVRMIATARLLMPHSMVRLSAGRLEMSAESQALCFLAGANSVFAGDKLLTTPNPERDADARMFESLGLRPLGAFERA